MGRGSWLICKINAKSYLNKIKKEKRLLKITSGRVFKPSLGL